MILKINLIITAIILFIIFVGCYRKYLGEKKDFNNGICPHCNKPLEYKGHLHNEAQYQCPDCGYTAWIGWVRNKINKIIL